MNTFVSMVLIVIIAYALGNISPAIILGNVMGVDIRKEGSGNAGTTNVLRVLGGVPALITLAGDVLKAVIAVRLGFSIGGDMGAIGGMLAFVAVILGHVFPALYHFKGGKGVASGIGGAFALDWLSATVTVLIFVVFAGSSKKVSVGSIVAAAAYPFLVWFYAKEFLPVAILVALFVIYNHIPNIKRLIKGEEPDFDLSGKFKIKEKLDKVFYDPTEKVKTGDAEKSEASEAEAIRPEEPEAADASGSDELSVPEADEVTEAEKDTESPAADAVTGTEQEPEEAEKGIDTEAPEAEAESEDADKETEAEQQSAGNESEDAKDYFSSVLIPALEDSERKSIGVVGAGSFGSAISNILVHNGHEVTLYGRNSELMAELRQTGVNRRYLPGAVLSDRITYTDSLKAACENKDIVVFAVPAQQFRGVAEAAAGFITKNTVLVNLAKGIEQGTLDRMSEIAAEVLKGLRYVVLSGPSHAEELVKNNPASLVAASEDKASALMIQEVFSNDKLRVYSDYDVTGVEIGGAIKNVYAIATGISDGMGFGVNAKAALMTRAVHELSKLGVAIGAEQTTFAGLSGIGDLMVTCDSDLSRNRRFGRMIGEGLSIEEAISKVGSVVEGYYTTSAAKELAARYGVECPIIDVTSEMLEGRITPDEAMKLLMGREQKEEKK